MSIRLAVCHRPSTRLPETQLGVLGMVGQQISHVAGRACSWGVTQQGRWRAGVLPLSRAGGDEPSGLAQPGCTAVIMAPARVSHPAKYL